MYVGFHGAIQSLKSWQQISNLSGDAGLLGRRSSNHSSRDPECYSACILSLYHKSCVTPECLVKFFGEKLFYFLRVLFFFALDLIPFLSGTGTVNQSFTFRSVTNHHFICHTLSTHVNFQCIHLFFDLDLEVFRHPKN